MGRVDGSVGLSVGRSDLISESADQEGFQSLLCLHE